MRVVDVLTPPLVGNCLIAYFTLMIGLIEKSLVMQENDPLIIDAVITWVNGNDAEHKLKMRRYIENKDSINSKSVREHYDQVNEIEFSVKSILKHAKFVRHIFIVTDNQTPDFLKGVKKAQFPNVFIIDHKVIFEGFDHYLPTFNSISIETLLHKIPNLSEHFIYLNDDFFLLKEATMSDFFINKEPVIRGIWRPFDEDLLRKRLQKRLYKLLGKRDKIKASGFKKSQQLIARKLGCKKYTRLRHTFTAMRKSVLENFYEKNSDMLEKNIKYRFRHPEQFLTQSLANHLEIQNGTCVLKSDYQLLQFRTYKKPLFWTKYRLRGAAKNKDKLFLCLQSLDQCPQEKLAFIKGWLQDKYN